MDETNIGWIPAIAFAPLAGAVVNGLLGKRLGKGFVTFVAVFTPALAFVLALALFSAPRLEPGVPAVQIEGEPATVEAVYERLRSRLEPGAQVELEENAEGSFVRVLGVPSEDPRLRAAVAATGAAEGSTRIQAADEGSARAYVANLGTWIAGPLAYLGADGGADEAFVVDFGFRLDPLSMVLVLIITGIGTLIHIYSTGYMAEEDAGGYARFFAYLNLFVAAMLILVMGSNLVLLFVGWEGVGLCSYLLIGFWYEKADFAAAGVKAFVVNRIGDFGFVLGMLVLAVLSAESLAAPTLEVTKLNAAASAFNPALLGVACLLLVLGATGKSAQIPLHFWLPDAMAGPTPVSALIHAATMVTAGVYMIARLSPLFVEAQVGGIPVLGIVAVIGVLTAFFAGAAALGQDDIKKVLAYSTVSQLGYMFVGVGVAAFGGAVFHLVTHAFFKALLFLGAGAVIHATHTNDMKSMGGLRSRMPITFWTMLVGALALAGLIPFSGFFSKDMILFHVLAKARLEGSSPAWLGIYVLGTLTAFLTALYSLRLICLTFFGEYRGEGAPHEAPRTMTGPLVILALGAVGAGLLGLPEVLLPHAWAGAVTLLPDFLDPVVAAGHLGGHSKETLHHLEIDGLIVGVAAAVLGVALGYYTWSRDPAQIAWEHPTGAVQKLKDVLSRAWLYDELVNQRGVQPMVKYLSFGLWRWVDDEAVDRGLVDGTGRVGMETSNLVRSLQTGQVARYAAYLALGAFAIPFAIVFAGPLSGLARAVLGLFGL